MSSPDRRIVRWVFTEGLAHVLAEGTSPTTERITVCGLAVAVTAPGYRVAPSLDVCRVCERRAVPGGTPPEFPTTPTVF